MTLVIPDEFQKPALLREWGLDTLMSEECDVKCLKKILDISEDEDEDATSKTHAHVRHKFGMNIHFLFNKNTLSNFVCIFDI